MREAGMSVMTAGKGRAGTPARRGGAAGRGRPAGASRQGRRLQERPGAGRHLRAVPDLDRMRDTPAVPDAGRVHDTPAVPGGGRQGAPAVPGARRPGHPGRAAGVSAPGHGARARDTRPAPRRGTVRLTRRGRIVVAALLTAASLLLVVLAWMAGAARAQAANSGPPPAAVYQNLTSVVVHPGQTLWSIASQAEPTADPRIVMQQIIDLNALHGTSIEPGQRLWVPRG